MKCHKGASDENPQHMFLWRSKKNVWITFLTRTKGPGQIAKIW